MIDPSWNWIPSHLEWIRSKRSVSRTGAAQSRSSECGRPVPRYQPWREVHAGSFCADSEVILLSAVAAASVGIAVGSRCWRRNDRKTKREPRTRLGVNLIFYSAARSWCASTSTLELGPRPGPWSDRMCECRRAEAPRHLGCETGDMPWKNPTDLLLVLRLFLVLLYAHPLLSLALLTDRKNSPPIPDFKARAIKSSSSWYATRVCKPRKSRLQVHRGDVTVSTAGI